MPVRKPLNKGGAGRGYCRLRYEKLYVERRLPFTLSSIGEDYGQNLSKP